MEIVNIDTGKVIGDFIDRHKVVVFGKVAIEVNNVDEGCVLKLSPVDATKKLYATDACGNSLTSSLNNGALYVNVSNQK